MNSSRFDKNSYLHQPICISSVESGEIKKTSRGNQARLHNHCIVACHGVVSARLSHYQSDSDALISAIEQFLKTIKSKKKQDEAKKIVDFIIAIEVVAVKNDLVQTNYPFKQFGHFSDHVSRFPEKIDWSDIEVIKRPRRTYVCKKKSTETQSYSLSDGSKSYLETYLSSTQ